MSTSQKVLQLKITRHVYDRIVKKQKFIRLGTYERFISKCASENQNLQNRNDITTEKHHIIPKHAGGDNSEKNIIILTTRQHILAHLLRFLEKGEKDDWTAYSFRTASKHFDLRNHGLKIAALHKMRGTGFYDKELNSSRGKRGGPIGGSRNTPEQKRARQKVGETWGSYVGLLNQSAELKQCISKYLLFQHKDGFQILISPSISGSEVFDKVHEAVVQRNQEHLFDKKFVKKAKGGGPMYALLKGKKKSIHGWSIIGRFDSKEEYLNYESR